jgi:hypothetical protein
MKRIYRFLELEIDPAMPAMEGYVRRSERMKRRPHRYSLSQFGLTKAEVRDLFDDYIREYAIPEDAAPPARRWSSSR